MSIGPRIPDIRLFRKLTLKTKVNFMGEMKGRCSTIYPASIRWFFPRQSRGYDHKILWWSGYWFELLAGKRYFWHIGGSVTLARSHQHGSLMIISCTWANPGKFEGHGSKGFSKKCKYNPSAPEPDQKQCQLITRGDLIKYCCFMYSIVYSHLPDTTTLF